VPTYQYACTACDHRFDAVQSFSDPSLTECPVCSGPLRKVFSSVGIVFKGSGFYRTDSRKDPVPAASDKASDKGSDKVSEKSADAASDKGSGKSAADKGSADKSSAAKNAGSGPASSGSSGSGSSGSSGAKTSAA